MTVGVRLLSALDRSRLSQPVNLKDNERDLEPRADENET